MARKPFDQQQYTTQGAANSRTYEENTGTNQSWKPNDGGRTNEVGGWGGKGYEYDVKDGVPYARPGTRMSDEDVERYRQLGARHQDAVQLDESRANVAKGLQGGSLARLSAAAAGREPSRAAILGQIGTEDALRANRGGNLAATRGALRGFSNQAGTAAAQVGDMRAGEATRDRNAYFGGALGMRKQDIGAGVANAQLEAANRDLEQRRQLQYEQLGFDTRNAEMFGGVEQRQQEEQKWLEEQKLRHAQSEADRDEMKTWISAGAGMLAGGMMSDPRTKRVMTYGSLAGLGRKK